MIHSSGAFHVFTVLKAALGLFQGLKHARGEGGLRVPEHLPLSSSMSTVKALYIYSIYTINLHSITFKSCITCETLVLL